MNKNMFMFQTKTDIFVIRPHLQSTTILSFYLGRETAWALKESRFGVIKYWRVACLSFFHVFPAYSDLLIWYTKGIVINWDCVQSAKSRQKFPSSLFPFMKKYCGNSLPKMVNDKLT